MRITAAQALIEIILENGIDTVFGYPGGAVLPLYDAFYHHQDRIRHIRTAHEQGAVFAADGYAKVTGRPGVCISTSGPGATNLMTGIANAYMDSVPIVAITGQAASHLLGRDAFQEIDITAMTRPITKHNFALHTPDRFVETIREAFRIAMSGRPGPVHLDIPRDVFEAMVNFEPMVECEAIAESDGALSLRGDENPDMLDAAVDRAMEAVSHAEHPVILAGGGVAKSGAEGILKAFAGSLDIPVAHTLMGLATFPSSHRLSLGLSGLHGHKVTNEYVKGSDLILAVGVRFSDRSLGVSDFEGKTIVQIDLDETEVDKNVDSSICILGDAKAVLERMMLRVDQTEGVIRVNRPDDVSSAVDSLDSTVESFIRSCDVTTASGPLKPDILMRQLAEAYPNHMVVTDVGQHQMWTAQHWPFEKPGSFITSGGLGTMGYGLGAAIGAHVGMMDKVDKDTGFDGIVVITGDGSFKMNFNELSTLRGYGIPIKIILVNNGGLGLVRQLQTKLNDCRHHQVHDLGVTDHVQLVKAFGIEGFSVETHEELAAVLDNPKVQQTVFIECRVPSDALA